MTIRVAFNATPLLSPLAGVGQYIVELSAALVATGDIDPYSFYLHRWRHEAPRPPAKLSGVPVSLVQRIKPWLPFRGGLRIAATRMGFASGLRRHAIDLYHEQNYVPLGYDVPVVITVHDLSWLRYPETQPADRVRWLTRGLPKALARAGAIIVDSNFVRTEVIDTFAVAPERVHTAHLGVSSVFRKRTSEETARALDAMGLTHGRYILTVGTIEPRKNILHALEAFARIPASIRERYPLVVAGARGWRAADIKSRLRRLADAGQIRFLGHVAEATLPCLYAGAAAFVFPSLYEGFGLPLLEAMASGVPVIASNRASVPEVMGDAGQSLDPDSPEDTAAKITALLEDPATRAAMAQRGIERAAGFTWQACAAVTRNVYATVAA
jgi:alpha-1,3-rhamnosyl/mannosyltransferase